jgi:hypothetical protein
VSVELARRVMWHGAIADVDVDAAIEALADHGVAFARTLLECGGQTAALLDRELERIDARVVPGPVADPDLCSALPAGMCEGLLAVPLRQDARGVVEVAAVDPHDPHVATEFSFHLDAPVRVVRARPRELLRALERAAPRPVGPSAAPPPPDPSAFDRRTPAFGSLVSRPPPSVPTLRPAGGESAPRPSDAPIPLVRRASLPPAPVETHALLPVEPEPVLSLTRPKAPVDVVQSSRPVDLVPDDTAIAPALAALATAPDPDAVVQSLIDGVASVATAIAVFSVKAGTFQGRASRGVADPARLRALAIASTKPSVLETAIETGYYLGPLPPNETHAALGSLLGSRQEVCVSVVTVAGKPALLLVIAGFRSAFVATRRAEKLAKAAGDAFGRILRTRQGSKPGE